MTLGGVDQSIHSNKIEYAKMQKSNSWFQVREEQKQEKCTFTLYHNPLHSSLVIYLSAALMFSYRMSRNRNENCTLIYLCICLFIYLIIFLLLNLFITSFAHKFIYLIFIQLTLLDILLVGRDPTKKPEDSAPKSLGFLVEKYNGKEITWTVYRVPCTVLYCTVQ